MTQAPAMSQTPAYPGAHPGYTQYQEQPPYYAAAEPPVPHSGLGIASFIISLIVGLGEFGLLLACVALVSSPDGMAEDSPEAAIVGLCILAGLLLAVVGAGLGLGGLFQPRRKRVFGVLGLLLNGLVLGAIALIIVIGIAVG